MIDEKELPEDSQNIVVLDDKVNKDLSSGPQLNKNRRVMNNRETFRMLKRFKVRFDKKNPKEKTPWEQVQLSIEARRVN